MNKPNQVVPSFTSVYLLANQTLNNISWEVILFNIIETDGSDPSIYNRLTGEFTAPVSAWYDMIVQLQTSEPLSGIRIVRNGDINFPSIGRSATSTLTDLHLRIKLGLGETLRVEGFGGTDVLALSGMIPDTRSSNTLFTMVKRFDDTKTF